MCLLWLPCPHFQYLFWNTILVHLFPVSQTNLLLNITLQLYGDNAPHESVVLLFPLCFLLMVGVSPFSKVSCFDCKENSSLEQKISGAAQKWHTMSLSDAQVSSSPPALFMLSCLFFSIWFTEITSFRATEDHHYLMQLSSHIAMGSTKEFLHLLCVLHCTRKHLLDRYFWFKDLCWQGSCCIPRYMFPEANYFHLKIHPWCLAWGHFNVF